jgi:uncharacterized protein (TIGR03067 family)
MSAKISFALLALGLAVTATAAPPDAPPKPVDPTAKPVVDVPKAPTAIDGAFTIVSGERDGAAIPAAEIKDGVVRFAEREIIGRDKNGTAFLAVTYTLDTTKTPWAVAMKAISPEEKEAAGAATPAAMSGLVKKDGMTVTLIYALPGGDAPTEFKTKAKQQLLVLKSFAAAPKVPDSKFEHP